MSQILHQTVIGWLMSCDCILNISLVQTVEKLKKEEGVCSQWYNKIYDLKAPQPWQNPNRNSSHSLHYYIWSMAFFPHREGEYMEYDFFPREKSHTPSYCDWLVNVM